MLAMNVKDVFRMEDRLWLRQYEKGGKKLDISPATTTWNRISRPMWRRPGSTATARVPSSARSTATPRYRSAASTGTAPGRRSRGAPGAQGSRRPSAITRFRATGITAYLENPEARVEVASTKRLALLM